MKEIKKKKEQKKRRNCRFNERMVIKMGGREEKRKAGSKEGCAGRGKVSQAARKVVNERS